MRRHSRGGGPWTAVTPDESCSELVPAMDTPTSVQAESDLNAGLHQHHPTLLETTWRVLVVLFLGAAFGLLLGVPSAFAWLRALLSRSSSRISLLTQATLFVALAIPAKAVDLSGFVWALSMAAADAAQTSLSTCRKLTGRLVTAIGPHPERGASSRWSKMPGVPL